MKKFRDQDIQKIKKSIFTSDDLIWIKNQISKLVDFIRVKNKSRLKEAKQLLFTIEKIISSDASLELRIYSVLAEIQNDFRIACGKNHKLWSLFYRDLCDQKILVMEKDQVHYTFARGLATVLQIVSIAIPELVVTKISESGKKELKATLSLIKENMPSMNEIKLANRVFSGVFDSNF